MRSASCVAWLAWLLDCALLFQGLITEATQEVSIEGTERAIDIQVSSKGGTSTLFSTLLGASDPNAVTITLDALTEISQDGQEVGTGEAKRHSLPTFAKQKFDVVESTNTTIQGIPAREVSFQTAIDGVGVVFVQTYIMMSEGMIDSQRWEVKAGDARWSIGFKSWAWCGCVQGPVQETGYFLDLDVEIKGERSQGEFPHDLAVDKYILGGGINLSLSKQIVIDGEIGPNMPDGYPRPIAEAGKTLFRFRFPRFSGVASSNLLIATGNSESLVQASPGTKMPPITTTATTAIPLTYRPWWDLQIQDVVYSVSVFVSISIFSYLNRVSDIPDPSRGRKRADSMIG